MYAGKNGTYPNRFYVYPANCIPAYAFCKQMDDSTFIGKETLTRIILSDKTKNIEDAAFKGCKISRYARYGRKRLPICCPKHWPIALQPYLFHWDAVTPIVPKEWETFAFIEGEPLTVNVQIGKWAALPANC